jgi:hypothetical protein
MDGGVVKGGMVGGVLGIFLAISMISKGEEADTVIFAFLFMSLLGAGAVHWWRERTDSGSYGHPVDHEVFRLQGKLRNAIQSATFAEQRGDLGMASHFRAEAAAIESQLRALGA